DRGRDADTAQRVQTPEATSSVGQVEYGEILEYGEIQRTYVQAGTARGHRPVPEERGQAARRQVQARGAAGRPRAAPSAGVGLRHAVAREAEAAPHVRRSGASVP